MENKEQPDSQIDVAEVLEISNEKASGLLVRQSEDVILVDAEKQPSPAPPAKPSVSLDQVKEECAIDRVRLYHKIMKVAVYGFTAVVAAAVTGSVLMIGAWALLTIANPAWLIANPQYVTMCHLLLTYIIGTATPVLMKFFQGEYEKSSS